MTGGGGGGSVDAGVVAPLDAVVAAGALVAGAEGDVADFWPEAAGVFFWVEPGFVGAVAAGLAGFGAVLGAVARRKMSTFSPSLS